jgi:hypothetical protein
MLPIYSWKYFALWNTFVFAILGQFSDHVCISDMVCDFKVDWGENSCHACSKITSFGMNWYELNVNVIVLV